MRKAQIIRKTRETSIKASIDLDGGPVDIYTGIGFFDHMLGSFACHSGFGLVMKVSGDLDVDAHHTVEDTGIVLGQLLNEALGDKTGIRRFASAYIPMDEALSFSCVDISNRPFLLFDVCFPQDKAGDFDVCLTEEFFRAFAFNAGITLHIKALYGSNSHHIAESIFKSVAHTLKAAVMTTNTGEIPSTKGSI